MRRVPMYPRARPAPFKLISVTVVFNLSASASAAAPPGPQALCPNTPGRQIARARRCVPRHSPQPPCLPISSSVTVVLAFRASAIADTSRAPMPAALISHQHALSHTLLCHICATCAVQVPDRSPRISPRMHTEAQGRVTNEWAREFKCNYRRPTPGVRRAHLRAR